MKRYYMLNKPRGLVSACTDARCPTVLSCFPEEEREGLFHVGRLDKDTEGLLLVTDDGDLCYRLMKPEYKVEKTYYFKISDFTDEIKASDTLTLILSSPNSAEHSEDSLTITDVSLYGNSGNGISTIIIIIIIAVATLGIGVLVFILVKKKKNNAQQSKPDPETKDETEPEQAPPSTSA